MKQPPGDQAKGKEHLVLKLNRSIYGLKQSANNWNKRISNELKNLGYEQGKGDTCLCIKQEV